MSVLLVVTPGTGSVVMGLGPLFGGMVFVVGLLVELYLCVFLVWWMVLVCLRLSLVWRLVIPLVV